MTNLPELLAQLAEWPEVCQKTTHYGYRIDDYYFNYSDGELWAQYAHNTVHGRPAHDWLQGALQRAIVSRGWGYRVGIPATANVTIAKVYYLPDGVFSAGGNDVTEALLTALIAALGNK